MKHKFKHYLITILIISVMCFSVSASTNNSGDGSDIGFDTEIALPDQIIDLTNTLVSTPSNATPPNATPSEPDWPTKPINPGEPNKPNKPEILDTITWIEPPTDNTPPKIGEVEAFYEHSYTYEAKDGVRPIKNYEEYINNSDRTLPKTGDSIDKLISLFFLNLLFIAIFLGHNIYVTKKK